MSFIVFDEGPVPVDQEWFMSKREDPTNWDVDPLALENVKVREHVDSLCAALREDVRKAWLGSIIEGVIKHRFKRIYRVPITWVPKLENEAEWDKVALGKVGDSVMKMDPREMIAAVYMANFRKLRDQFERKVGRTVSHAKPQLHVDWAPGQPTVIACYLTFKFFAYPWDEKAENIHGYWQVYWVASCAFCYQDFPGGGLETAVQTVLDRLHGAIENARPMRQGEEYQDVCAPGGAPVEVQQRRDG